MTRQDSMINQPTLLLNSEKARHNIKRMAEKARLNNLAFRPHFKTHQSATIGEWFREEGVKAITVSSVSMAAYFVNHGWDDITIAFPVNLREMDGINELAQHIKINLLVESPETARQMQKILKAELDVFIEIDTGSRRSGIVYNDIDRIAQIIEQLHESSLTHLTGFLTHSGHTYQAGSHEEILQIHRESLTQMRKLKARFAAEQPLISIGDTPSCSLADDFSGADEMRPGNFVFYDLMQAYIGSCSPEDIAVAVACPVVAKYPQRYELVIYGGAIHLSKDSLGTRNGGLSFGRAALLNESGWEILPEGNEVVSVSQEHGVVKLQAEFFNKFSVGDLIAVIPVHSCLTAHQLRRYQTLEGDIIQMMD